MITVIPGLPGNVLGFSASGKVTASDYETVLVPAVEAKLQGERKLRLLYHLGADFDGFAAGAMWADAKLGLQDPSAWERIALVTDVEWLRIAAHVFGFAMPGHVRVFSNTELSDATKWVTA